MLILSDREGIKCGMPEGTSRRVLNGKDDFRLEWKGRKI